MFAELKALAQNELGDIPPIDQQSEFTTGEIDPEMQGSKPMPDDFEDIPVEAPQVIRDPFEPPEGISTQQVTGPVAPVSPSIDSSNPYERYPVSQYVVVGIFLGKNQKAFLRTPNNELIRVAPGYRLGIEGGVVWKIRPRDVLVIIPNPEDGRQSQVVILKFQR